MKTNKQKWVISLLFICVFSQNLPAKPQQDPVRKIKFHGIRPTDPIGRIGLANPERGFRIETKIAKLPKSFKNRAGYQRNNFSDEHLILNAKKYEPFGLTLAQTYCYLDEFADKPIPAEKLDALQKSFGNLRKHGYKAILRFAYETAYCEQHFESTGMHGPKLEWILKHIDQLKPIIRKNTDVIFVMQAGFIGAWGEWHHATHIKDDDYAAKAKIVAKLFEVLPKDRMTQVRVPKYKKQVLSHHLLGGFEEVTPKKAHTAIPAGRIGFNNDGFLAGTTDGGTWCEPPHFANPGNPEFDYMTRESAYLPVDGELYWSDKGGKIDGTAAAVRMRLHHYSSFSLAHSYSGHQGQPYSIDKWMTTAISKEKLIENKMPISDGYFEDAFGKPAQRTEFEYICDHLGYRLELQQAKITTNAKPRQEFILEASLINRGFSTLHNPRPIYIVLIDKDEKAIEFNLKDTDPRKWQPFEPGDKDYKPIVHKISFKTKLPPNIKPGSYKIGIWLPDKYESIKYDARYDIRFANRDILWWTDSKNRYGVNVLCNILVEE